MPFSDNEETGRFRSDKLEMLIDDHARLSNENRILQAEVNRLNQVIAETAEKDFKRKIITS